MDVRKSEIIEYLKLSGKVESEYNGIEENDDNEGSEADVPYEEIGRARVGKEC